jgi:hypothetical protein
VWCTAYGERTLKGAEAILFAETLLDIVDEIRLCRFYNYYTGVEVFDRLTFGQKISVLAIIGNGLLRKDVPCVELTDVVESAIGAVFEHLINLIAVEIAEPEHCYDWREKVIAARKESARNDILSLTCDDLNEWIIEVGYLIDDILLNAGFSDDLIIYCNLIAEDAKLLRRIVGISDNYYSGTIESLSNEEIDKKIKELRELCLLIVEAS